MVSKRQAIIIVSGFVLIIVMILSILIPIISGFGFQPLVNVEGIYVYEGGNWKKVNTNGTFWFPTDNGTYLIYLRNLQCPACQRFDPAWADFLTNYLLKNNKYNITPVEIVCTYFSGNCADPSAKATFQLYEQVLGNYFGTPYLILISNQSFIYYNFPPISSGGSFSSSLLNQTIIDLMKNFMTPKTNTTNTTSS